MTRTCRGLEQFVWMTRRGGQFYCLYCDKHFTSKEILEEHYTRKFHKKKCAWLSRLTV